MSSDKRNLSARGLRCEGRYSTGEFKGMRCIEQAKSERHGIPVCTIHAKVFDRFLSHGFDYTRLIVKYEWGVEIRG